MRQGQCTAAGAGLTPLFGSHVAGKKETHNFAAGAAAAAAAVSHDQEGRAATPLRKRKEVSESKSCTSAAGSKEAEHSLGLGDVDSGGSRWGGLAAIHTHARKRTHAHSAKWAGRQ